MKQGPLYIHPTSSPSRALDELTHPYVCGSKGGDRANFCLRTLDPALDSYMALTTGKQWVSMADFAGHVERFGLSFLTEESIERITQLTKGCGHQLLSVFTGLGYSEAQLAARGMNVIGFDQAVEDRRWLHDVRRGPMLEDVRAHSDRALFLSFPDRVPCTDPFATKVAQSYLEAGGKLVFVITDETEDKHALGCSRSFFDTVSQGTCALTLPLLAWPMIESLMVVRSGSAYLRPTLKAYLFE